VLRGGSWYNFDSDRFRCAIRYSLRDPTGRRRNDGFRCAMTL
jgi:formylglycine-generating enzyme required for sulfatase activity